MKKIFEFVKIGGIWFYWSNEQSLRELEMQGSLLDTLDNKFVRLQMVDQATAKITLSKVDEDEFGAFYMCKSRNYNGKVRINNLIFSDGGFPTTIYLREL